MSLNLGKQINICDSHRTIHVARKHKKDNDIRDKRCKFYEALFEKEYMKTMYMDF